ncbi:MAG: hypothetical protein HY777_04290 [Betaproteobacteria bacterium]|nr:hypothetical protein [Betaproteobacteria bacterium]
MRLTLLVPELVWPEPDDRDALDDLSCPALTALIARGRFTRRAPQSLEAALTDAFGWPEGAPYAALRLLGEASPPHASGGACWICADPVHLRFHRERLVLADSGSFGIALDEAHAISGELNRQFSSVGMFHVAAADRWYFQCFKTTELGATDDFDVPPLSAVAGRFVGRQLPEAQKTRWLRKLLNDAQMILHGHPANAAREEAGHLPINSLWLWGAGTLPEHTESQEGHFDGVWSTHPLAIGLGRAAGVPTHTAPPDAAALLAQLARPAPGSHHLVLLENLLGPVQYQNGDDYRRALQTLEKRWFAPLRRALASGRLKQLRLEASTAYGALCWESRRADQWKLWLRAQPLATVAQNLAKATA